jgi:glycerol-3-phosphate dehydrogenase
MKPLQTDKAQEKAQDRAQLLARLASVEEFDLVVIGGGATGLGTAVDASVRGLKVLLVEAHDFAKGTSSRSTKLIHGGVRYLAQGHLPLVWEALHERKNLLRNAPHVSQAMPFIMPAYRRRDQWFYGLGLKLYDLLAGRARLGATRLLSRAQTLLAAPGARITHLVGGVQYWDGQFDDARLALALARTAAAHGAIVLNHMPVTGLMTLPATGKVCGVACLDQETGIEYTVKARCVVNATGVWVDDIEAMTHSQGADTVLAHVPQAVRPSQGVHLVVDASFWPGDSALLVPHTEDGRVLFAVPWQGKVLLGTTDTPKSTVEWEPQALATEVDQILAEAAKYLVKPPARSDVTSVWAGLRPLAGDQTSGAQGSPGTTKNVSREHTIKVAPSGLITVTGGKWTTYRAMAADVMQSIRQAQLLSLTAEDVTVDLPLWGAKAPDPTEPYSAYSIYGTDGAEVKGLPGADQWLTPTLSEAMVRFAARNEYARTVEDVLARRSRLLFLDAREAARVAPAVADILTSEIQADPQLAAFLALAQTYQLAG